MLRQSLREFDQLCRGERVRLRLGLAGILADGLGERGQVRLNAQKARIRAYRFDTGEIWFRGSWSIRCSSPPGRRPRQVQKEERQSFKRALEA